MPWGHPWWYAPPDWFAPDWGWWFGGLNLLILLAFVFLVYLSWTNHKRVEEVKFKVESIEKRFDRVEKDVEEILKQLKEV